MRFHQSAQVETEREAFGAAAAPDYCRSAMSQREKRSEKFKLSLFRLLCCQSFLTPCSVRHDKFCLTFSMEILLYSDTDCSKT